MSSSFAILCGQKGLGNKVGLYCGLEETEVEVIMADVRKGSCTTGHVIENYPQKMDDLAHATL